MCPNYTITVQCLHYLSSRESPDSIGSSHLKYNPIPLSTARSKYNLFSSFHNKVNSTKYLWMIQTRYQKTRNLLSRMLIRYHSSTCTCEFMYTYKAVHIC